MRTQHDSLAFLHATPSYQCLPVDYELVAYIYQFRNWWGNKDNITRRFAWIKGTVELRKKNVLVTIPGYPQLKSNPGRWFLNIREGRSADIYGISSHENTEVPGETENVQVLISSFKSAIIKMKVFKKKDEELLQADGARYGH